MAEFLSRTDSYDREQLRWASCVVGHAGVCGSVSGASAILTVALDEKNVSRSACPADLFLVRWLWTCGFCIREPIGRSPRDHVNQSKTVPLRVCLQVCMSAVPAVAVPAVAVPAVPVPAVAVPLVAVPAVAVPSVAIRDLIRIGTVFD